MNKPPRQRRTVRPTAPNRRPEPGETRPTENSSLERTVRASGRSRNVSIAYIALATLVVCSMLALALQSIGPASWFNKDDKPITDPNADLVAAQETIVAEHPESVEALVELADMYAHSNRSSEAYATFDKAVKLDPNNVSVRYPYARALQDDGHLQDAEAQYLKVLELDPHNQNAHYYLAQLYLNWDPPRREDAKSHLESCAEINPDSYNGQRAKALLATWNQTTPVASPSATP